MKENKFTLKCVYMYLDNSTNATYFSHGLLINTCFFRTWFVTPIYFFRQITKIYHSGFFSLILLQFSVLVFCQFRITINYSIHARTFNHKGLESSSSFLIISETIVRVMTSFRCRMENCDWVAEWLTRWTISLSIAVDVGSKTRQGQVVVSLSKNIYNYCLL